MALRICARVCGVQRIIIQQQRRGATLGLPFLRGVACGAACSGTHLPAVVFVLVLASCSEWRDVTNSEAMEGTWEAITLAITEETFGAESIDEVVSFVEEETELMKSGTSCA